MDNESNFETLAIKEDEALTLVNESYSKARNAATLDLERFGRYYKLFRNEQTNKNYTGLANLFIPEPYRIVRKKTAKLANAIRSIKVIPESSNDIENAKNSTRLLNYLRRKLNWQMIEKLAIQESRIVGLSWIKAIWNLSKEEFDKPYKGFELSMATVDQVFVAPGTTVLDVFNNELEYLIHEYEIDIEDIKENPNYNKEAVTILETRGGSQVQNNPLSQARLINQDSSPSKGTKKTHKIREFWGEFNDQPYLIVVADDSIVLRADKNPYADILSNPIPFVPIVANPIGKEFYPVGDIEPAEALFNELNDTRNQRMDTVTLNIDPMKIIVRGAQIDKKQLIAKRGWVVESNIPGGVQVVSPDMQGIVAATNEEKAIRGDIAQVTGVLDFAPGSDVQAGLSIDTARGTMVAKGEADVIIEDEINNLKMSLTMLYRIALAYAQVFLDRAFEIRILDKGQESFAPVDRTAVAGNFDLDIEMRTLQDRTTEQQLQILLFNQAKTVPGSNIGRFWTDVLESFKDNINIDEYYQEPQPGKEMPKVSISLSGQLSSSEVDEIYKLTGADPQAADPILREDLRQMMRGNLPENIQVQMQKETPQGQLEVTAGTR